MINDIDSLKKGCRVDCGPYKIVEFISATERFVTVKNSIGLEVEIDKYYFCDMAIKLDRK